MINTAENSNKAQRERLMRALEEGPVTTIEARKKLDILMPSRCVFDLRHNYNKPIHTTRVHQETDSGVKHNVAQYFLGKQI